MKSRFVEAKIISAIKEQRAGEKTAACTVTMGSASAISSTLFATAGQVSDYVGAQALLSGVPDVDWLLED